MDADVLPAAEINASSLDLLNAGSIPMRGIVCAIAVARSVPTSPPRLVTESSSGGPAEHTGCFAFLFGVDRTPIQGTVVPPSKMVWKNYRARPGNAFSVVALAEAENLALEGATAVWTKMKESLSASSFTWEGLS